MKRSVITTAAALTVAASLSAQTGPSYPVVPRPLPDSQEITLARSAAPPEVSASASVYTIRDGKAHLLQAGSNGCACMVARDLHEGSLYPICFDVEGTKTVMPRELMEVGLRASGRSEEQVISAVDSAYQTGALRTPTRLAVAYMMSPRQVLFSSPLADGRRVGAWHPHVMLYVSNATNEQLGLRPNSRVTQIMVGGSGTRRAEIIIRVPEWSNGAPAQPRVPAASDRSNPS